MCSAGTTGRITSGGGFSQKYSQPDYQAKAVSEYFINAAAAGKTPYPGFNAGGRAYPDISMNGLNYLTILYGNYAGHAGTSASTPVAAAAVSNINAARMAIGKGSLGWLNPALYTHAASFVNDIVIGNNTCSATAPCCPHGFHATKGWDPATGLGSINYGKMEATFLALGAVTNGYSRSPTPSPSTTMPSTQTPTRATASPSTRKPTVAPTFLPTTRMPTRRPTLKATSAQPTSTPTGSDALPHQPTSFPTTPDQLPTPAPTRKSKRSMPSRKPKRPTFRPSASKAAGSSPSNSGAQTRLRSADAGAGWLGAVAMLLIASHA